MNVITKSEYPSTVPTQERTPAKRRDGLGSIARLTALMSAILLANSMWWALADGYAPVLPAWLLETLVLGLISIPSGSRGRLVQWLIWLLQPLGIALLALVNTTLAPSIGLWTIGLSTLALGISLGLAVLARRITPVAAVQQTPSKLADFRMLMKFRIISLLLLTTLVPLYLAYGGWPSVWVVLATLLGGTLAAGGANAINMYIDRDIDAVMSRTKKRPLPGNRLTQHEVLGFGLLLSVASFAVLAAFVNLLSALLALSGIFYYVVIYTIWLKRSTVQNIVIGGGAGAIPPLVGWAAGLGSNWTSASFTDWLPAIFLFALVFYWTPPHFWALAIVRRDDYARAGVPMLPVVKGERETRRQIVLYTLIMLVLSLMIAGLPAVGPLQTVPTTTFLGPIYLIAAGVFGAIFLFYTVKMLFDDSFALTWRLYKYSLLYLALLFVAMGVDRALLR